jgi:hypothetical protein
MFPRPYPQKGAWLAPNIRRCDAQGRKIGILDQIALHRIGSLLKLVDLFGDIRRTMIDVENHASMVSI